MTNDEHRLEKLLRGQPVQDILALVETCAVIIAAQVSSGKTLDEEERAILDRALANHPPEN
jgi:hypothetical protein